MRPMITLLLTIALAGPLSAAPPRSGITVTPSGNVATAGMQGGPFTPATFTYAISASAKSVGYRIGGLPTWLTASRLSGTTPATITFIVNSQAAALAGGLSYYATLGFTNTTNGLGNATRTIALTVNAPTQTYYLLCGSGYCLTSTGDKLTTGALQGSKSLSIGTLNFLFVCSDASTSVAYACR